MNVSFVSSQDIIDGINKTLKNKTDAVINIINDKLTVSVFALLEDFKAKFGVKENEVKGVWFMPSESDIKKYASHATLKKGLSVVGSQAEKSKDDVEKWLKSNRIM